MSIKIERERWIIIQEDYVVNQRDERGLPVSYKLTGNKNNRKIFCGTAKHYDLKTFDELHNATIKTYYSKNKAIASFQQSWYGGKKKVEEGLIKAVRVKELIEEQQ